MKEEQMAIVIGKIINKARKRMGYSQQELAGRLYIQRSAISMYESGKRMPDTYTLKRIAEVLNIPLSEIANCNTDDNSSKTQIKMIFVNSTLYDMYMILNDYSETQQKALLLGLNILANRKK